MKASKRFVLHHFVSFRAQCCQDASNGRFCYHFEPFVFGRHSLATAFISELLSFHNNPLLEMAFHSEWPRNNPKGPHGPIPPRAPKAPLGPLGPLGSPWVSLGPLGSLWVPLVPLVPLGPLGSLWVPLGLPLPPPLGSLGPPLGPPKGSAPCRNDKKGLSEVWWRSEIRRREFTGSAACA